MFTPILLQEKYQKFKENSALAVHEIIQLINSLGTFVLNETYKSAGSTEIMCASSKIWNDAGMMMEF